jgi:hypothetical protein
MANPNKDLGTKFETATVAYLRERTGDSRIERRAMHGNRDMGDVYGIRAHGYEGIAECKRVERLTADRLDKFKRQALDERGNADADFVLLIVWRRGKGYQARDGKAPKSFGENVCYLTLEDLLKVSGATGDVAIAEEALGKWVCLPLADAADMIVGEVEE